MALLASAAFALGGAGDRTADFVFGQPNFTSNPVNNGGVSATAFHSPAGIAVDVTGRIYVTDRDNHRVLVFSNIADTVADIVFGQPNFSTNVANNGGVTATSLHTPSGIAVDATGRIYVADEGNNRILVFDKLPDTVADHVLGQPSFRSNAANNGGVAATTFQCPTDIAVDTARRVYVVDQGNHRVLIFNNLADTLADKVLGQRNFTSKAINGGAGTSRMTLYRPNGIAVDVTGRVYVADRHNHRVLIFNNLADTLADMVLGQRNFSGNGSGTSSTGLSYPRGVAVDAAGRVYVADYLNDRVLVFHNLADTIADRVFGQPTMATGNFNHGGLSATSLHMPYGMAIDATGRVYVADFGNHRVLAFSDPFARPDPTLAVVEMAAPRPVPVVVVTPVAPVDSFARSIPRRSRP